MAPMQPIGESPRLPLDLARPDREDLPSLQTSNSHLVPLVRLPAL